MKIAFLIVGLALTAPAAFGWSKPGHEAVANAAMSLLKGTPTEAKVKAILAGETSADASTWLDHVRDQSRNKFKFPDPKAQKESVDFNASFHNNDAWHYVDYPIGSSKYSLSGKFSSPNDVVHALQQAVAVLEGKPSPMTKRQALRVVFHLVGDIHQPLHCGTGFFDLSDMSHPKRYETTAIPAGATEDRGGNQLYYTKSQELHALWDSTLPDHVSKTSLAAAIAPSGPGAFKTPGDYHRWAEKWAGDSMSQATAAYKGIKPTTAAMVPKPPGKPELHITVSLPGGNSQYTTDQTPRAKEQLTKAAAHLAQLLQAIHFK